MKKVLCLFAALTILLLSGCQAAKLPTAAQPTEVTGTQPTIPAAQAETQPPVTHVEVWREGEVSEIPVEIVTGTVGRYTIAMDPEYFNFLPQQTADLFSYSDWTGDQAVYYAVSVYRGGYDPGQFESDVLVQYESRYENWYCEETTIGRYPATLLCLQNQLDAPAYSYYLYLVDCGGACYLIETEVYAEMLEGLYRIMRACFDTFTVIS